MLRRKHIRGNFNRSRVRICCGWESLYEHNEAPEWFQDAKLGIYFHWGTYSVPAFGIGWYPRNMHRKRSNAYKYHMQPYGNPSDFGYHDFVPMFNAENSNEEEWAVVFKLTGFGPDLNS